jgi:hypothetical protein
MRVVNSSAKRTINSTNKKYIIECGDGKYRIGNVSGNIPKNSDCIITNWHIKNGKIVKRGKIDIVPGNGNFHIANNIIEFGNLLEYMKIDTSGFLSLIGNIFRKPRNHNHDQVVIIDCKKLTMANNVVEEI